jgi:hypothetical protein
LLSLYKTSISPQALSFCNFAQAYRGVKIMQTFLGVRSMARKKINLDEEAVRGILVAETDPESGAVPSEVEHYFQGEEEEHQQQAQVEFEPKAVTSG